MSLNDIHLPSALLEGLYGRSLVLTELAGARLQVTEEKPVIPAAGKDQKEKTAPPTLAWLGNNQRQVTVIVQNAGFTHLPDNDLELLTAMLKACGMSLNDVAVHNFDPKNAVVGKDIVSELKSKTVLLFGVSPESFGLPIQFPAFQVQQHAGITYLYTPALAYFQEGDAGEIKQRKSDLWVCLRTIFGIKK
jgi:hypothetical protein